MKLIINADDFGLTRGVNLGIIEACNRGIVRSATVMAGMDATAHAAELARQTPSLKTGIHLRLTAGAPMAANVPSLLGEDGNLQKQATFWPNTTMVADEIERELRAQIESLLALGFTLSHIDGHHHCHSHPLVSPVVQKLATEYGLPVRPCGEPGAYGSQQVVFTDKFYGEEATREGLLALVQKYMGQADILEIMTHPALVDQPLIQSSGYWQPRVVELAILTDPTLAHELEALGVTITDYSAVAA